jgi:glucosyl-3-phosphoglycerate synthase
MPDFQQNGLITTLHDLGTSNTEYHVQRLETVTGDYPLGLILPVTAGDMRAPAFDRIIAELQRASFIDQISIALGVAPDRSDYRETCEKAASLSDRAEVMWTDGPRIQGLYQELIDAGLNLSVPGKGRSVWTSFGYLLADPQLKAFVLHDCDIANYEIDMLARLCLPMAEPSFDFEFCKAYYTRCTDRMHGRVVRLLVAPLLQALTMQLGHLRFLDYLASFRYPLSGEFAVTSNLARSNRIPCDWGLEVGTLAEVYRNTSIKRVCQVELCRQYEHKHQNLSLEDPEKGLQKMARDILTTVFRTLASMGTVFAAGEFIALRSVYLRSAQDLIRQYHADAQINGLGFDRHSEEQAVEGFAARIADAGETFQSDPAGGEAIPNWSRVLTAFPDFPARLRQAVKDDSAEL